MSQVKTIGALNAKILSMEAMVRRLHRDREKTIKDLNSKILILETTVHDIHREVVENSLDKFTGLMSRKMFWKTVEEEILSCLSRFKTFSIFVLDLSNFKGVNDAYGYSAGDELIKSFAVFLKGSLRDCDMVARTGGAEFIVFLPTDKIHTSNMVRKSLLLKIAVARKTIVHLEGVGIGSAVFGYNLSTIDDLYDAAYKDMYIRKKGFKR